MHGREWVNILHNVWSVIQKKGIILDEVMLFCFTKESIFYERKNTQKTSIFTFYCMLCKYKIKSHTILLKLNKLTNDQNKSTKTNACNKYVNK